MNYGKISNAVPPHLAGADKQYGMSEAIELAKDNLPDVAIPSDRVTIMRDRFIQFKSSQSGMANRYVRRSCWSCRVEDAERRT